MTNSSQRRTNFKRLVLPLLFFIPLAIGAVTAEELAQLIAF